MQNLTAEAIITRDRQNANALHALWTQGQKPFGRRHKRYTMTLISKLTLRHTGVYIGARTLAAILDAADIYREHYGGYTTAEHWLSPETGAALKALSEPPEPPEPPPALALAPAQSNLPFFTPTPLTANERSEPQ